MLSNLRVVEQNTTKNEKQVDTKIVDNPKCLLFLRKNQKISRNEKCEATGKKYKNCCGAL